MKDIPLESTAIAQQHKGVLATLSHERRAQFAGQVVKRAAADLDTLAVQLREVVEPYRV